MLLSFACTRGANSVVDQQDNNNNIGTQASSTLLWSSVGANNQSNNTVSEQLPLNISSDPFEVAAEGNGFKVYSSPVIFKGADNNIYVIALWAKSGESKLVKYTYNAGSLTADASFNVSLTPASEFKTHQVILSKEDGDVFIYVSHKDGVDKYSATGVKQLTFGNADDSVSALLVDNQNLYVQLADGVKKYSTTSGQELNAVTFSGGSDSPERVLPMVVSGDFLYVAQPNTIYKLALTDVSESAKEATTYKVSNLAAFGDGDGIIYSIIYDYLLNVNNVQDNDGNDVSERTFSTTFYDFFGGSNTNGNYPNTVSTLYHEENGNKQSAIGSNDHSALAVNNTDYYVPGFYSSWGTTSAFAPIKGFATQESAYAESTKLKGLVKVTGGDTSSLDETNRVFDVTPVARVEEYYLSEVNPAVRFAVFDTAESRSFTVENTNATLFDTLINAKKISEDNDGLGIGSTQ